MHTNKDNSHINNVSIIAFNAPPGSGKDFAAEYLSERYDAIRVASADHLKDLTHEYYGLHDIPANHYDSCKNEASLDFNGLSPREAYIDYAENHVWTQHGNTYFIKKSIEKIINEYRISDKRHFCLTDLGFYHELEELEKVFENIVVIKIITDTEKTVRDSRIELSKIDENGFSRGFKSQFCYVKNEYDNSFTKSIDEIASKIYNRSE